MKNIKLLDCTLRDGGYLNDWEFGNDNIISIFERLISAEVDIIEVGFLNEYRCFDINRTIMPDSEAVEKIYGGLDKAKTMIVGMIDYGTCSIDKLRVKQESFLDGIRVIFKKSVMYEAIKLCGEIKQKGYKVFVQAVSITSYNDEEMMTLIKLVNELQPYAFSLVDTYGLLDQEQLMHYFEFSNCNLNPEIGLGYHSHNNFQLAYANCMEVIKKHSGNRMIILDGSLYGMGKSAGNAPSELLAMYLNEKEGKNYHISQMLEAIDVTILELYNKIKWGYSFKFYISALHDCHPNYVTYLMDKKNLSVHSINHILDMLEGNKKLLFDQSYIEQLYLAYQEKEFNDTKDRERLRRELAEKEILLLAPGNTIESEKEKIKDYINKQQCIVISVNYYPKHICADYLFISNSKRYVQMASILSRNPDQFKIIATSNITRMTTEFDFVLEYSRLLDREAMIVDNPLIMLLRCFREIQVKKIVLAGFDGYKKAETPNYINPNMEHSFTKERAEEINRDTREALCRVKDDMEITFLTKSFYE